MSKREMLTKMTKAVKKKVLIAIPCVLRGGTEMQTLLLARVLVELGYDVEVYSYFENDPLVVAEFKATGAVVKLLNWSRSIGAIRFIRSLATIFRESSPALVHVQYMAPGLLPIIAGRMARVPIVLATVHYPGTPHGIVAHGLLRFGTLSTNCFTCVSEAVEKSWFGDSFLIDLEKPTDLSGRRHLTIPNAVDIEAIDKARSAGLPKVIETASKLKGKMIVGTVARLSREKGINVLLEAFALVQKCIPDAHMLIVGNGNQMDNLQSLARQLGIDNSITWMGQLSWETAIGCVGLMDVVAIPSRFEGFGLTAVEAMACCKPVVASRVDGLAELFQDGVNGYLVQANNTSVFAEALIALLKDEELRKIMGISARKHVEQYYSYPLFKERYRVLYEAECA